MAPEPRPPFPTYLLPSLSFPFRRRSSSSTVATTSSYQIPSLSSSPTSSPGTTPGSSPPEGHFILPPGPYAASSVLRAALGKIPEYNDNALPTSGTRGRGGDIDEQESTGLVRAQPNMLRCVTCATDIALASQVVSKGFTGRHGRAYLVSPPPAAPATLSHTNKGSESKQKDLINIKVGRNVNRELLTGQHVVADVSCMICGTVLGWKYVDAREASQKYKIGKFILEMKRVVLVVGWEDAGTVAEGDDLGDGLGKDDGVSNTEEGEDGVVVFDSEDEDECEDLFAGVWDAEVVAKRRGRMVRKGKEG